MKVITVTAYDVLGKLHVVGNEVTSSDGARSWRCVLNRVESVPGGEESEWLSVALATVALALWDAAQDVKSAAF